MPLTALTTSANVKTSLDINGTGDDSRIVLLIAEVSADVQKYCGRTFYDAAYTELRDGLDWKVLQLAEPPVRTTPISLWVSRAIPRVYDVTTKLIEGTDYVLDATTGRVTRLGGDSLVFPCGAQTVKATYDGGFAAVPADLERAVIEVISVKLQKGKNKLYHVLSENRGDGDVQFASDNAAIGRFDWPIDSKRVFDSYVITRWE